MIWNKKIYILVTKILDFFFFLYSNSLDIFEFHFLTKNFVESLIFFFLICFFLFTENYFKNKKFSRKTLGIFLTKLSIFHFLMFLFRTGVFIYAKLRKFLRKWTWEGIFLWVWVGKKEVWKGVGGYPGVLYG